MKKIFIILLFVFIFSFISCVPKDRIVYVNPDNNYSIRIEKENPYPVHIDNFFDAEKVIAEGYEKIWVDKNTDVLYYSQEITSLFGITPIFEADGTPLTYTEWQERHK